MAVSTYGQIERWSILTRVIVAGSGRAATMLWTLYTMEVVLSRFVDVAEDVSWRSVATCLLA
jgi:hypothetical protein